VLLKWTIIAVTHSYDMLVELSEGLFSKMKSSEMEDPLLQACP